jgi:acyl carrier protein
MKIDSILKSKNIFFKHLEKELEIPFNSLNNNLENNEYWDSLAKMTFVAMMDKQFKIKIKPKDLLKIKRSIDIYNLALKFSK